MIIDASNYYPQQRDGRIAGIEDGLTESGWVEHQLGRPVIKAFNTILAKHLLDGGKPAGAAGRIALAVAGDDPIAKAAAMRLIDQIGFDTVDAGPIGESWRQQPGSPGYLKDLRRRRRATGARRGRTRPRCRLARDGKESRNLRCSRLTQERSQFRFQSERLVMFFHRTLAGVAAIGTLSLGAALIGSVQASRAVEQTGPAAAPAGMSANDRLIQLGPEGQALARRAGTWDATFTSWDAPGAAPITTGGLVADREMIGPMLQERLHTLAGVVPAWTRIDDVTFNRTEGRWDYMSMDMRAAAGMMSAWSLARDPAERISVSFQPFALPGNGPDATGQMMRMEEVIIDEDADHEVKDQYFTPADGIGTRWLAKRYSYTRRHPT